MLFAFPHILYRRDGYALAASEIFLHAAGSGCDSSGGVSDASQPLPGDRHGAGGNAGEKRHVGLDQ